MPIRVTCPGCHTRFNVSDKFAGKSGPCPKCKRTIKVPSESEEVKVHEPQHYGPKGAKGEAVLKPIFREQKRVSPVQITLIATGIIGFLLIALILRYQVPDKAAFPTAALALFAALLAFPLAYAGYSFLRDDELAGFQGRELWVRVGILAGVYALLWLCMPLANFAFGEDFLGGQYSTVSLISACVVMVALGGFAASLALDFEYLIGIVHYAFYFGVCVLGRWIAGLGPLPGLLGPSPEQTAPAAGEQAMATLFIHLTQLLSNGSLV